MNCRRVDATTLTVTGRRHQLPNTYFRKGVVHPPWPSHHTLDPISHPLVSTKLIPRSVHENRRKPSRPQNQVSAFRRGADNWEYFEYRLYLVFIIKACLIRDDLDQQLVKKPSRKM